ncbi:acyl carrier protein [Streptomyces echinoruber]|uniref:acyl carrier protein n=1 Tax=Streptomyces echinoruber TaxID=68898 RepID=UPI001E513287|nr:acyl carrier protein [Streptomyces echinoruber]
MSILTDRFEVRPELVSPQARLTSLGLDSLFVVELSFVLEGDHGVEISLDELAGASTLSEIAQLMQDKQDASL